MALRASALTAGRNAANMLVPSRVGAFLTRKVYCRKVNDVCSWLSRRLLSC